MRKISDHRLNGLNETIDISVLDEADGISGANHAYEILIPKQGRPPISCRVDFQNGPIHNPNSVNGITNEALLAVLIDRLRGFQGVNASKTGAAGGFACKENACALTHLEEALHWLHSRTIDRVRRGVEGKLAV